MVDQPSSRSKPYISPDVVQAALDSIVYNTTGKPYESLFNLACVAQYIRDHDIPASDLDRDYALKQILMNGILDLYQEQRKKLQLDGISAPEDIQLGAVRHLVTTDTKTNNSRLRALSLLFARYFCGFFEISPSNLAEWASVEPRTVTRWTKRGIHFLVEHVLELEQQALQLRRESQMWNRLPVASGVFVNRTSELEHMTDFIRQHTRGLVIVVGEAGIGKTRFLLEVLSILGHNGYLVPQNFIWIESPKTQDQVFDRIEDVFGYSFLDIQQVPDLGHQALVVIDGLPTLDPPMLSAIGRLRNSFMTIAAVQEPNFALQDLADVYRALFPLKPAAAAELASQIIQHDDVDIDLESDYAQNLLQKAAGSPMKLKRLFRTLPNPVVATQFRAGISQLDSMWIQAPGPDFARAIFVYLCRVYRLPIPKESDLDFPVAEISGDDDELIERGIILDWLCRRDRQPLLNAIVEHLTSNTLQKMRGRWIHIAEDLAARLPAPSQARLQLLSVFWPYALRVGHLAFWRRLLGESQPHANSFTLSFALGEIYSRSGQDTLFEDVMNAAVRVSGQRGEFVAQAEALFIVAKHLHRRGRLAAALRLLEVLKARPRITSDFVDRIQIEITRVYISVGQIDEAADAIENLIRPNEFGALLCCIEILFFADSFAECEKLCEELQVQIDTRRDDEDISLIAGYLEVIRAQCMMRHKQTDAALDAFERGMLHFSTLDASHLPARSAVNFAALLYDVGREDEARHLLNWARKWQEQVKDTVGLLYTMHNLEQLQIRS